MVIDHLAYYLIHQPGMIWRTQDFNAHHMVKCVKDEQFNGSFASSISGRLASYDHARRAQFCTALWPYMSQVICHELGVGNAATIVPVPNSDGIVGSNNSYKTLAAATEIARCSNGQLSVLDALRWQTALDPQHRTGGARSPESRFVNLARTASPNGTVVLFDDFITSGASLIAAHWRLQEANASPSRAFIVGRRTIEQHPEMIGWFSEELPIPPKPMF